MVFGACLQIFVIHKKTLHVGWGLSADLLTKEEMRRAFPTPETMVGPIYRSGARLYGKDLAYPLSLSVIAAALHFLRALCEGRGKAVVRQMWANVPAPAPEGLVSAGSTLSNRLPVWS